MWDMAELSTILFQSTLPAWGETGYKIKSVRIQRISIHSPRMGRDRL